MESSCSSGNLPAEAENLNEATPAIIPAPDSDLSKDASGVLTHAVECDDAISSTTPDKFVEDLENEANSLINMPKPSMSSETDADFFSSELSISDVPTEKITENVEDIVQDLENLLGESNDSYRFSRETFDSSKLADSYDEVNSSNVTDLFGIEQTNLDGPSFDCNIVPDISSNIECEVKEAQINEPQKLEVIETTTEINTVSDLEAELENVVSEPVILETPEEANTVINVNTVVESQNEAENTSNDVILESEVIEQRNISSENIDLIKVDTVNKTDVVLETETEAVGDTDIISTSNVCPEVVKICANSEVTEACTSSEIESQPVQNTNEIVTVCEESVENTMEPLEELIKDSDGINIESSSGCLQNLLDSSNNDESALTDLKVEEKEESTIQEESIQEPKTDLIEKTNVVVEELPQIVSENSESENILLSNNEIEEEKTEALSETVIQSSSHEKQTIEEVLLESNDKSDAVVEVCPKIIADDVSESITTINDEVSVEQKTEAEPEIVATSPVLVNEENTTIRSSIESDEQSVSTRSSVELVQPLTVEVENPDFTERHLTEITTEEQTPEKETANEDVIKSETIQPQSDIKQAISIDSDNQVSRAPLKMTITKHKSDNVHSILKIYDPNDVDPNPVQHIPKLIIKSTPTSTTSDDPEQVEEQVIPKITIKSVLASTDTQHSPRLTIKPIKPPNQEISDKQSSPKTTKPSTSGTGSPRITIKPIVKPESLSPIKLTLRPYPKLEEVPSSPKLNIKPIVKPAEESLSTETHHSPKITIKPIVRTPEEMENYLEEKHSPRITIKPVIKPSEESAKEVVCTDERPSPRITIKPIIKPPEEEIQSYSEEKHSPKITIKPVIKPPEEFMREEQERHSPRITIKPIIKPPDEDIVHQPQEEKHSPRITIKPIVKPIEEFATNQETSSYSEERHSPKVTIKPVKKPDEECESSIDDRQNLRITIKPVIKQTDDSVKEEIQSYSEERYSPRITIKPVVKPLEESTAEEVIQISSEERPSPRITIKPVIKPPEESGIKEEIQSHSEEKHSPRITIKPIIKPPEETTIKEEVQSYSEEKHSPRITIKPVIKPSESEAENSHSPRITIKPVVKPSEDSKQIDEMSVIPVQPFKLNIKPIIKPNECSVTPKVTIKPVPKPLEPDDEPIELIDFEEQIKQERIVLKIAKNTKKEMKESEKLKKIKVKLSKERGLAHIVPTACESFKRSASDEGDHELKHFKSELPSDLTISLVPNTATTTNIPDVTITRIESTVTTSRDNKQEETVSKQHAEQISSFFSREEIPDPLADIPIFEITLESATAMSSAPPKPATVIPPVVATPPAPRKRGRPRKVPLEVREEFKDPKEEETAPPVVEESTRPKRSCRGASVKATLGIKPRKPRAPSTRGRGGRKSVSTRASTAKKPKERKSSYGKLKLSKDSMVKDQLEFKEFETKDAEFKQVPLPAELGNREVVIYEEETRMSAENSSRAQTPAKQVLTSSAEGVEESQSSVQSNTTTESGEKTQKVRKGPRLEVHQEPEGEVISADKLAEYSWGGGGPYMLQEQVAQFLGIKSFKRKYPGIQRRPVDMQERDFIRESCLASEAMCDMGLTAVRSEDILDIMYTDFQHKYEEYCKHQRDRQAKDVSNKQKALSLAASQEKNKLDIVEQAVQSAFQWNANFNKARREQRRACMDLQTFTVHFPKGKMKQVNKPPIGNYPLALVPGQYTDYYKKYNPLELGNLPLNSVGCKTVSISSASQDTEESQSDGSGSDSDSSSSDSDSSDSSSGAEDCKMCTPTAHASKKMLVH